MEIILHFPESDEEMQCVMDAAAAMKVESIAVQIREAKLPVSSCLSLFDILIEKAKTEIAD